MYRMVDDYRAYLWQVSSPFAVMLRVVETSAKGGYIYPSDSSTLLRMTTDMSVNLVWIIIRQLYVLHFDKFCFHKKILDK